MTREEFEMRTLVRESDVIDRTDGSELAKAFNYLWEKYVEQEPCEDAISRDDALMALTGEYTDSPIELLPKAIKRINALPPVTPQPKVGHWLDIMVGDMPAQACDRCNTFYPLAYTGGGHKYCPNCGAKMESEVEE